MRSPDQTRLHDHTEKPVALSNSFKSTENVVPHRRRKGLPRSHCAAAPASPGWENTAHTRFLSRRSTPGRLATFSSWPIERVPHRKLYAKHSISSVTDVQASCIFYLSLLSKYFSFMEHLLLQKHHSLHRCLKKQFQVFLIEQPPSLGKRTRMIFYETALQYLRAEWER